MREKLLQSFDKIWIENMHGNRKITERAPDGHTSETVFAIQGFSAGIQQGVTISLMAKTGKEDEVKTVLYRGDNLRSYATEIQVFGEFHHVSRHSSRRAPARAGACREFRDA